MGNLCAGPPGSDDVVQFDNVRVPAAAAAAAAASDGGPPSNYERKRRPSQSHAAVAEANPTVSSVDALAEISEALKSMPFFDDVASLMTPQNLQRLALLFVRQEFKRDQVIINEGQRDECFHLIVSGKVRVSACVGDFHIDLCDLSVSQWFGDSALCNDQMQPVTVRALQSTSVLSLARRQFTNFIQSCPGASSATLRLTDADANINLQDMPFFRDIPLHTLSQLKVMFEFRRYPVGSYICRQGDKGDGFYLVARGRVAVSVTSADGQELVVATLSAGEWFGEIALIEQIRRTASIRAVASPLLISVDSDSGSAAEVTQPAVEQPKSEPQETCLLLFLSAARFANFLKVAPEVRASGKFDKLLRQRSARWLQTLSLFASFRSSPEELDLLGDLFRFVELPKGQFACVEGGPSTGLNVIVHGQCHMLGSLSKPVTSASSKSLAPTEVILSTFGECEWFGEFSFINRSGHSSAKRTAAKTKKSATSVRVASDYCLMLRLEPQFFDAFSKLLSHELRIRFEAMSATRVAERLKAIPFFAQVLDPSKLATLGSMFTFEEHAPGTVLCRHGDDADRFYIVIQGSVKCYVPSTSGTSNDEGILKGLRFASQISKDGWFGEIGLLHDTPRTATVIVDDARTVLSSLETNLTFFGCLVCTITKERFATFLSLVPELRPAFNRVLASRTATTLATLSLFADSLLSLQLPATQALTTNMAIFAPVKSGVTVPVLKRSGSRVGRPKTPRAEETEGNQMVELAALVQFEQCQKDALVYRKGDAAHKLYMIMSGSVEESFQNAPAVQYTAGQCFGECAIDLNQSAPPARPGVVRALEKCVFFTLSRDLAPQFLALAPEFQLVLTRKSRGVGSFRPSGILAVAFRELERCERSTQIDLLNKAIAKVDDDDDETKTKYSASMRLLQRA